MKTASKYEGFTIFIHDFGTHESHKSSKNLLNAIQNGQNRQQHKKSKMNFFSDLYLKTALKYVIFTILMHDFGTPEKQKKSAKTVLSVSCGLLRYIHTKN